MSWDQTGIYNWQCSTFGETALWPAFERFQQEYFEFRDKLHAYVHNVQTTRADDIGARNEITFEMADMYITMVRVAGLLGTNILQAVDEKMDVNEAREWNVGPDGNGQHVE